MLCWNNGEWTNGESKFICRYRTEDAALGRLRTIGTLRKIRKTRTIMAEQVEMQSVDLGVWLRKKMIFSLSGLAYVRKK